jgi:hypothetical protein
MKPALVCLALLACFWSGFAQVAPTNFGGYDEWLIVSLASRDIVSFPHANRPLNLLFALPGVIAVPDSLTGYRVSHVAGLVLTAAMVFLLGRRLAPENPMLAFLAAAFTLVWAPSDVARLNTVQGCAYSGFTFATLLALVSFVESWVRRSFWLLGLGAILAVAAVRSYEGTLPLLLAGPLLLFRIGTDRGPLLRTWTFVWAVTLAAAGALAVWPMVAGGGRTSYQSAVLGIDANPLHVGGRLLRQYEFHILPLVATPPSQMFAGAVLASSAFFLLAYVLVARQASAFDKTSRRRLAAHAALGLVLAALGYSLVLLSNTVPAPFRMQFLSAPGIALFLAAGALLAAGWLPRAWRSLALGLLAVWVVAVGTARTGFLQRVWDGMNAYHPQRYLLRELVRLAPDLKPGTAVLLLDEVQAFPATFTFRHAVEYLYDRRAVGVVWGASDVLYASSLGADGIHTEPWPVLRKPWDVEPAVYRYDEVVVVRFGASGRVEIAEVWPLPLPALPPDARYDPATRILPGPAAVAGRRLLANAP